MFWLAYRLRRPLGAGRGYANVVARSEDGVEFETVTVLDREEFGSDSLERPALVPVGDGSWHLYVSCATPGTLHWRVDVLVADHPSRFDAASAVTVLPGDHTVGVKDPVIKVIDGRWHMWLCCHPLDLPDDTDRMSTRYGTSDDGLEWALRTWPWPARPGPGINGGPGWPTWSTGTAAGWPTTTVGPTRRRTPRSGPASPPATPRGR